MGMLNFYVYKKAFFVVVFLCKFYCFKIISTSTIHIWKAYFFYLLLILYILWQHGGTAPESVRVTVCVIFSSENAGRLTGYAKLPYRHERMYQCMCSWCPALRTGIPSRV